MSDVHDSSTRSYNMSRIKSKNTKPELIVRKYLYAKGFRYRVHNAKLPGKPDISLAKYKAAIFVNGCFWHGHKNCKYFKLPATNVFFWKSKIEQNKKRDMDKTGSLQSMGWKVIIIWECELKPNVIDSTLNYLINRIVNNEIY